MALLSCGRLLARTPVHRYSVLSSNVERACMSHIAVARCDNKRPLLPVTCTCRPTTTPRRSFISSLWQAYLKDKHAPKHKVDDVPEEYRMVYKYRDQRWFQSGYAVIMTTTPILSVICAKTLHKYNFDLYYIPLIFHMMFLALSLFSGGLGILYFLTRRIAVRIYYHDERKEFIFVHYTLWPKFHWDLWNGLIQTKKTIVKPQDVRVLQMGHITVRGKRCYVCDVYFTSPEYWVILTGTQPPWRDNQG